MFISYKKYISFLAMLACTVFQVVSAQRVFQDTVRLVEEDTVYALRSRKFESGASPIVKFKDYPLLFSNTSLLPAINTMSGIRMEERSPGSYRINIRGSSLRSPFGVRNVKVYWNEIPLTDPGGNTYFNQLAGNNLSTLTIIKSTATVSYGSGTGGQILISNMPGSWPEVSLETSGGSYGAKSVLAAGELVCKRWIGKISYAHNESNGYRQQSALRRDNFSWTGELKLSDKQQLMASVLFSNMYYQTPGGLTLKEYEANPAAARPAVGTMPSAVDAKAAIFQKNLTGGLTYKQKITAALTSVTTLYGAYNRIQNSAIRNYEMRNEPHAGGRTVFVFKKHTDEGHWINWQTGAEFQRGDFNIKVLGNIAGMPDSLQTNDAVNTTFYTLFSQLEFRYKRWGFTSGLSYNKYRTSFTRLNDVPVIHQPFSFISELIPRVALSLDFNENYSVALLATKGFSPPAIAELLPSTGVVNTALTAEYGWNYELILKAHPTYAWEMETSFYYFKLQNALVQQRDESGADYFTNAGGTNQSGIETRSVYNYVQESNNFFKSGKLNVAYSYNFYRYKNFIKNNEDFSDKVLPGVPSHTISLVADIFLKNGFYTVASYYGASSIFLNDANTVKAEPYQLVTCKAGYLFVLKKVNVNIYAIADNLLNELYSLGNDINAAAGRYYNAAPPRNYCVGAAITFRSER